MCSLSGLHFPFILLPPIAFPCSVFLCPQLPPTTPRILPLCSNAIVGYSQSQALNARSTFLSQGLSCVPLPFFSPDLIKHYLSKKSAPGHPALEGLSVPISLTPSPAHFSSLHLALPEITSCLFTSGLPATLA